MSEDFFRHFGASNSGKYSGGLDSGAFKSLYDFIVTLGSSVYGLLLQGLIFLILIFTTVAYIKGYIAQGAPQRQEAKDMLTRNALILMLGVSLTGLIATIFKLFSW